MVSIYKSLKCEFRYEILIFILVKFQYIDNNSSLDIEKLYEECSYYIKEKEKYHIFRDKSYIKKYCQDVLDELNNRRIIRYEIGKIILINKKFALEIMMNIEIINKICSDILIEIAINNKKINENFDYSHIYSELSDYEKLYFNEAINKLINEKLASCNGYNISLTQKGFGLIISDKDDIINKICSKILDKINEIRCGINQFFYYNDLYSELNKYEKLYFNEAINQLVSEGLILHDKNTCSIALAEKGFYRIHPINN